MKRTAAVLMVLMCFAHAQSQPLSILEEKGQSVRLVLIDASLKQTLGNTRVEFLEKVVCKKAPCPPLVVASQTTGRDGSVIVARNLLSEFTLVQAFPYFPRELGAAEWKHIRLQNDTHSDVRAWTLELSPRPSIVCHDKNSAWTMSVYASFAEVRNDGKPVQFGILHCKSTEAFTRCGSGTRDAGFAATLNHRVSLASKSAAGPHEIAQLECSFLP
jgi:hypothetical protein